MLKALSNIVDLVVGDSRTPEQRANPQIARADAFAFTGAIVLSMKGSASSQVRSKGFILELAPLVGANDRVNDIISSLFADILLPGTDCGFITNYASPRIAEKLQDWALPRFKASGVFQTLARHRIERITATVHGQHSQAMVRFSCATFVSFWLWASPMARLSALRIW